MSQLSNFDGGLNTRINPLLIGSNESVICNNVDLAQGILSPVIAPELTNMDITSNIRYFSEHWVHSPISRDYVEYNEILYYTDGIGVPQKSTNGSEWYNLGIKGPISAPITVIGASAASLSGTYQYCYTYYNNNDGAESQPSPYSAELVVSGTDVWVTPISSIDPQVTHIRLYRIGGLLTVMSLVAELPNTGDQYADNIADADIIGTILTSTLNGQAPMGLTNLASNNAMLFGSVGGTLYYSDIAYINSWSPFNFIQFIDVITGIGAVPNGLIVCTKFQSFIVVGNSPESFSRYLLSSSQGCLTHKSMQYTNNMLVWLSTDGVCASNGSTIEVISRNKLGKLSLTNPKASYVFDDVYYLSHDNGTHIFDFRFNNTIATLDFSADSFGIRDDILYFSSNNKLYSITGNIKASMSYRSANLSDGRASELKTYKVVYVKVLDGELDLSIFIDGQLVVTHHIDTTTREVLIPQEKMNGSFISFLVEGTGSLAELEYKPEGRHNGR